MPLSRSVRCLAFATAALLLILPAAAQQDFSNVEIKAQDLGNGIHMLVGAGGNIGVSAGDDGVFLVDDQYAPLTEKILAAVGKISDRPVRFVLNTHWHGDHTGGNENMGEKGALIVAHDNVRERMSTEQFLAAFNQTVEPSPDVALPVVTFAEGVSFHVNGEEIHAAHMPHAHTDGDSVVHFKGADVVHMGDLFFNGMYPFIDTSSGGSIDGMIAAADKVLAMVTDSTKIIPGHGPLASKSDLQAYRDMLQGVRDAVGALVKEGKSVDEVKAAAPTKAFDEKWGGGFMKAEVFVPIVYESVKKGGM